MSTQFTNRQWRLPNEENKSKVSNYSMDFDSASSDYIDSNLNISSYSEFSVSLWLKRSNSIAYVVGQWVDGTSSNQSYVIQLYNNNVYFNIRNSSLLANSAISTTSLNNTDWYHIGATWDGSNIKIYINGTLEDTTSCTTMNNPSSTIVTRIGGASGGSLTPFNGSIDGVAVFDYALSSSQITTLYGSSSTGIGNPITLNPVAYYPLGDQDAFNGANYLVPNSSLKDYVFDFIPNDYIDCGTGLGNSLGTYTGDLTFSIWFNTDTVNPANDGIFYIGDFNSQGALQVNIYNNNIIFRANGGAGSKQFSFTDTTSWHNLTCVYLAGDRANSKLYLDGVLQTTSDGGSFPSSLSLTGLKTIIGSYYNSSFNFDGKLSNFQIFNTALPATGSNSVETLYNNGSPLTSMSGFTSLVSWWKLDASATYDSSTNTWTIPDDSTNSNDGTSSGMTQANLVQSDLSFTSGYSPYALNFDGTNDYIDCGDSDDFSFGNDTTDSPFSVSFFVNLNSYPQYNSVFVSKDDGSPNREYAIGMFGNKYVRFFIKNAGGNNQQSVDSTTTIALGSWYHVVATYDGSGGSNAADGMNLYINSINETTGAVKQSYNAMANTTAPFRIGQYNSQAYVDGKISNVSVWNTELTSSQVSEIYSEGIPQNLNNHSAVSSLVSWWQLGSNSSFNSSLNQWTCIDEKGTNTGESSQTFNESAIVDGVGSYANGLSSGMGGDEVIGSAPFSDANSLSVNMDVEDRVTDTPS